MSRLFPLSVLLLSVMVTPAWAKSKDKKDDDQEEKDDKDEPSDDDLLEEDITPNENDFKEEADPDDKPPPRRLDPDEEEKKEEGELDFEEGEEEDLDFDENDEDEQESLKPRGPGEDTAQLYRDAEKKYREMSPEEELIAWEQYLQKYPKSLFRERIDERVETLSADMYNERVPGSDRGARASDAARRELNFFQPVHMSSADPRQKIILEAGWGFPNWVSVQLDYEHAFTREASAHAGIERNLTGYSIGLGAKYAIIKSARTGTILSGGLDVYGNTLPAYAGLRPILSFGQRFQVMDGLDVQAQVALDLELRNPFGVRWNAGLGAELHPNKVVSVFVETDIDMKYVGAQDVPLFFFNTAIFGLKFVPRAGDKDGHGRFEAGLAADAPYAYQYWGFYRGGVDLMGAYYF